MTVQPEAIVLQAGRRVFRILRLFRLLLFVLCVAAAVLLVAHILGVFPRPRGTHVAPVRFTLCSRANRTNCVVDGDTIHYQGVVIRVEDIDTPETHGPKCASERARGMRATYRMLELVNAGPFQIVQRGRRDTDKYGRKLRTLERNGRSFGDILIAEGLARRWDGARHGWCG
jgi:endonuclease YncB( thermonuclease family)